MIKNLQSLRFIFAVFVFLHHTKFEGVRILEFGGPMAVTFFMMLSGYVMACGYYFKILESTFSYKNYILKRIFKLYPLHIICMLLFLTTNLEYCKVSNILPMLSNVLMVQCWMPIEAYYFSGNPVSWFLSCLFLFYILFPFLARLIHRYPIRLLIFILFVFLFIYLITPSFISIQNLYWFYYVFPLSRMIDFLLGVLCFFIYNKYKNRDISGLFHGDMFYMICEIALCSFFVFSIFIYNKENYLMLDALWWFPCALCLLYFGHNSQGWWLTRILSMNFMSECAAFSFTFYMIHVIIILAHRKITWFLFFTEEFEYIRLVVLFLFILLCSKYMYKYVELPITRFLQQKYLLRNA